jgi:hypothetical protein
VNLKKIWIYLAVLVGIAAFWLTTERFFPKKTGESEAPPLYKGLDGAKIKAVKWEKGEKSVLLKNEGTWTVAEPIAAAVDEQVLADVLQTLAQLRPEKSIPLPKTGLREFGLEPPGLKILFLFQGRWQVLEVGRKTAVGTAFYVKIPNSSSLYLVQDYQVRALDRDLFALRDKRIFSFSPDKVRNLELHLKNKTVILVRNSQHWEWPGRPNVKLNAVAIDTFIANLLGTRAVGFPESGAEETAWGLKDPPLRIVLRLDKNGPEEEVKIGLEIPGKGLGAWSSIQKRFLFLAPSLLKIAPRVPEDWENKGPSPLPQKGPHG